jgi:hypothetical protein
MTKPLKDVVAVDLVNYKATVIATDRTSDNAQAVVKMAVLRRGCEENMFVAVPAGKWKTGDRWIARLDARDARCGCWVRRVA